MRGKQLEMGDFGGMVVREVVDYLEDNPLDAHVLTQL